MIILKKSSNSAIDFEKYSLLLIKDNKIIHSSEESGLRPLLNCITIIKKEHPTIRGCILHDRAIGLAAAKLVVYSRNISGVNARIASRPAIEFLEQNKIPIQAETVVDNILRKDKKGICPMELLASKIKSPKKFFEEIKKRFIV